VIAEGEANSKWLLKCLSRSFAFKTSEPLIVSGSGDYCTFRLAYGSHLSHRDLEGLLLGIPGVRLRIAPEANANH
jgi:hypothetical protein